MPQRASFTSPHFLLLMDPMDLSPSHVSGSSAAYQSLNLRHSAVHILFHPWTLTYSPCWARQVTPAITFLHLDLEKVLILFLDNKLHDRIHLAPLQGTWENIQLYLYFGLQWWQNWFMIPPPTMRGPNRIHAGNSVSYIPYKHLNKPVSIEKHKQLDNHLVWMITKEYQPFSLV